ncbi:unnamed protein product, partial [Rotaria sp. Silwood2]
MYNVTPEDVSVIMKFSSNAPIIRVSANTNSTLSVQAIVTISNKHDFSINKYHPNVGTPTQTYPESSQTTIHQQTQLPLNMDSILNGTKGAIVDREYPNQEINPSSAAILTGHDREITCLWISAELGIVLSSSEQSLVLQHTLNVIGGDRGFVQIIRTHDLQPAYAYSQCDVSIRSLAITHDQ